MFKIEYDLTCLTCEELIETREQIQRMLEEIAEYRHDQIARMTDEEKTVIAQALAIDEETGEWLAGA